ncbi:hypothetical protein PL11201_130106 [Planktothrix sp. PCC 11201]|uniref:DUF362 domain-containing protein n=1 Tax=Planktothrix sp. PCC 11201 TaxID=1729650 RepID=UPI0009149F78|nr:DUF362 domain-containing protein [Planktothrix sp. PCC 11201]SKB11340.1 hypothetical protein PL11201_130106 [Planktothrix sp. PCC 11201]
MRNSIVQGVKTAEFIEKLGLKPRHEVEGVCSPMSLGEIVRRHGMDQILGDGIRILDADTLPLTEYPNLSPQPVRFKSMFAPSLLTQVDCRISIGAFKRTILNGNPLISASLKNLFRPD